MSRLESELYSCKIPPSVQEAYNKKECERILVYSLASLSIIMADGSGVR